MAIDKFERIEKKFWMDEGQMDSMCNVFREHMMVDQYGESPIRNIYYDTDDYYLTRRSIEGPDFKEKLRVRSYQGFDAGTMVYVELKRKVQGIGYKRRIQVDVEDAEKLLNGEEIHSDNPQIEKEILQFVERYHPKPQIYLSYIRVAMYGKDDPTLRITVDKNIRYRMYQEGMEFDLNGNPAIEDEIRRLMEIKAQGSIPDWLVNALSEAGIYQTSFSKIGTCFSRSEARKSITAGKEIINNDTQYFVNTGHNLSGDYMPDSSSCRRNMQCIDIPV